MKPDQNPLQNRRRLLVLLTLQLLESTLQQVVAVLLLRVVGRPVPRLHSPPKYSAPRSRTTSEPPRVLQHINPPRAQPSATEASDQEKEWRNHRRRRERRTEAQTEASLR